MSWLRRGGCILLIGMVCSLASVRCEDVEDADSIAVEPELEPERAFLLVRKQIAEADVVIGKNLTVVLSIYNAGNSAAFDVSVEDPSWPEEYFSSNAEQAQATYARIASGASVQFNYSVSPFSGAGKGQFQGLPAVVQYRPESNSDFQVAYSTTPAFFVLSKYQTYIRSLLTLGSYLTGGAFTHPSHWSRFSYVAGGLALLAAGAWVFTAFREASKRRRYQKAYAEVQKYE